MNRSARTTQGVLVQAVEPNVPPVAVASSSITSGPVPLDVIFHATGSHDPDGFIGNIHWVFSDGGEYWGGTAYHTFYSSGTWQATLTVFDGRGGTGTKVERCQGTAVFCGANPAAWTQIGQAGPDIDFYGDVSLPAGTTYSYRVRAFNVSGHSSYSNTSAATTLAAAGSRSGWRRRPEAPAAGR